MSPDKMMNERKRKTAQRLSRRFPQYQFTNTRYVVAGDYVQLEFEADGTLIRSPENYDLSFDALEEWALEYVWE